ICVMKRGEKMEEINIKDLFEFFISKIRIITLVVLIVVLIGAVYSLCFQDPMFESTTNMVLTGTASASGSTTSKVEGGEAITQNDINLNSKLVATYREIIKSKTVLKDVINTLDLEYTTKELYRNITVSTVSDTEMISITVKSLNAEEAAKVANKLAEIFSENIKEIYNIENISIIDKAEIESVPTNINVVKQLIIYFLIGFVVACGIVFVLFYFDTTLKDVSQIEKMGFVVLTSIPERIEEGGKK
ncbi:MAG: hypothetical protein IKK84_04975, partial [Clostridia bacterium]|nr:hypothetical protein [Clostridia bacterium]